jgi:hypothetical protein
MEYSVATSLLQRHLEIWSETDPEKRRSGIDEIYTDDVEFIDPFAIINGKEKLDFFINDLQSKNPGFVFTAASLVTWHHNIASLDWNFGPENKPDAIKGQDVIVIKDGRIEKLYAFINGL